MKIIKLDAIGSTNSFLKDMSAKVLLDNFTVVVARNQTLGRGQVNANWKSEGGKNLTFSVFCRPEALCIADFKYLNYSVSLSVYELLISLKLPRLAIKWPNDILSENKKIAGILIENTLNIKNISTSIIGIGLNVNQNIFSDALPNASSVKRILKKEQDIDLDLLLDKLLLILKKISTFK
ncbi:biotin--[acetyl-CoA-carboxylase] ligase [Tenacibaculum dicentrarchi]|nr:biotin--[acetyl-CoA-carboxylase] ligase [Tenacibaculum dicentrarchi]WBX68169.1 biotin--[acetyl-CoA-carboxylase] ligase [Tenacibaculum dicentrarchi]